MPGISNFSKEDLADKLFAAVKSEAAITKELQLALRDLIDTIEAVQDWTGTQVGMKIETAESILLRTTQSE